MSKIVYLIDQPLDQRNYDRFGIQSWIDRGWNVEVWDLAPWVYDGVLQKTIDSGDKLKDFTGYFLIAAKSQLEHRYSKFKKIGYFIDLTGDNNCSIKAKMFLIRRGAKRILCSTGTIPAPDERLISKVGKKIAENPIKGIQWLTNGFVRKLAAPFIKPTLFVVSGAKSSPSVEYRQEIIRAHNFDYDAYLKLKESKGELRGDYAVFIDQNYCFHSDFLYQERPFFVTPERYFPAICNALQVVSETLKVDIRIAAHPRAAHIKKYAEYFKKYVVEYGKTADLVKGCKVVVCHNSTAVQFAVLYGKPVIFLTTNELVSAYEGKSIDKMASELGKSAINVDKDLREVDWERETSVDSQKYSEYRNNYIKIAGSPEMPFWDIVINHIEKVERRTVTAKQME